jgi:hypothetical protein
MNIANESKTAQLSGSPEQKNLETKRIAKISRTAKLEKTSDFFCDTYGVGIKQPL